MRFRGLLIAALVLASPAAGQGYKAPRTAFGQPDLQGTWNTQFILPMEARPDTPSLTLPEAEALADRKAACQGDQPCTLFIAFEGPVDALPFQGSLD